MNDDSRTRRSFLQTVGTAGTVLAVPRTARSRVPENVDRRKHPNILFIFADQLKYSALACNGDQTVRTPNIDRFAGQAVSFNNAFSSCPVCAAYRGQVLTGRYSHANGVIDNEYILFDGQTTIADRLSASGYRTAYVGKWHLGYGPYTEDKRHGFDDLYANNCEHNYFDVKYWHNEDGPIKIEGYAPQGETRIAVDYIKQHCRDNADQPFALFLAWGPPHWNFHPQFAYDQYPEEYDIYNPADIQLPGNVPKQFADFARREYAGYYAMITALDDCMGTILRALDELGLSNDTIVCFSSDHGDHLSAHGYGKPDDFWMHHSLRGSKLTPYEESIHIPFILRYPGIAPAGHRTDTFFSSVDVYPTLMALCGLQAAADVQGKDLHHAVLGTGGEEPDSVYLQNLGPGWSTRVALTGLWRGVRTRQYVYARWKDLGGRRFLFDRETDPLEMVNVVEDPKYADVARSLEDRLQKWIEETADPFDTGNRLPETGMLDLGQRFSLSSAYDSAPKAYAEAIAKYRSDRHE